MKLLVINGPSLNLLGIREPALYGTKTYDDLCDYLHHLCAEMGVTLTLFQSNHEGDIVDKICEAYGVYDALVINPAAYTHTSVAIADALRAVALPAVEVHLTDLSLREPYRQVSYVRDACLCTCMGRGFESYADAVRFLVSFFAENASRA